MNISISLDYPCQTRQLAENGDRGVALFVKQVLVDAVQFLTDARPGPCKATWIAGVSRPPDERVEISD